MTQEARVNQKETYCKHKVFVWYKSNTGGLKELLPYSFLYF